MALTDIPSVLVCDVGNTRIRLASVKAETVGESRALLVDRPDALREALRDLWEQIPAPKHLAACSVNPSALEVLEAAARDAIQQDVLLVGRDLPLPIQTHLPHAGGIGADRLCAAVAAYDRLGTACVVVDFGTAVTIDCVNDEGVFQGGAILPGLAMAARSLHAETAQLPEVEIEQPAWVFGADTDQAILSGVFAAARGALQHLVEAYATELGHWPVVIVTGGDAERVCDDLGHSALVQAIVPDLVLRGVAMACYNGLAIEKDRRD